MQTASTLFPKPRIPLKPVVSWGSFAMRRATTIPTVLDAGHSLYVTSGRAAIALALRHAGISPGHRVLLPAYHCTSMVEPVVWVGAQPVFYRIGPDTQVDLDDVQRKLDRSVRAILVTHYFGVPQDLAPISNFCKNNGLVLIEDCAHAFFGRYQNRPLGSFGDYSIASAMKFFPIYDGGCLVSPQHRVDLIPQTAGGWRFQVKTALNSLEHSLAYRRLGPARVILYPPLWLKDFLWQRSKQLAPHNGAPDLGPGASDGAYAFDPRWLDTPMSISSKIMLSLSNKSRIIARRRSYYQMLLDGLSDLRGVHPLFPALAEDVVPYVFPLLVDEPERVFPVLKHEGVPILRFGEFLWDGVDSRTCPVAADLSRRLFQFPCHQELRADEIEWMIRRVRAALDL
jgi:dTDP-4-amino-4,6-dideoxygalactose transaminase